MSMLHELIASTINGSGGGGGGGSGMERFAVTFTQSGSTFTSNKTLAEITAAKNAGKYVEGVFSGQYCPLVSLTESTATFQMIVNDGSVQLNQLLVVSNGTLADGIALQTVETAVTVSDAAATIEPEAGNIYKCGTLTSLTVTSPPAAGHYVIKFTSGSTATTTTIPASVIFPEAFAAEANTRYEIDVQDGYAAVGKWAVS